MKIRNIELTIIQGDITRLEVDALVNPANSQLKMDKGLAGFIKKEGGEAVELEAQAKGPLKPGEAVVTGAGNLKARHIIHAVTAGPGGTTQETVLRAAAANALRRAQEIGAKSLAFPALGCGEGNFPPVGSAKVMAQEVIKWARRQETTLREVVFCLYDKETFEVFNTTIHGYVRHLQEDLGGGPYVTVDIIIEYGGGIVLIERSNPPYGLALPGGFVDYGETLEQAAIREAKEETDLDLLNLRQFHTYSDPNRDPRFHTIAMVFVAEGQGEPKSGDDAKDLRVVRYEDLPDLDYAFDHKDIIKEYLMEKEFGDDHF